MSEYLDDAEESAAVCDESKRRARKPHTCHACGEKIAPGQTYARDALLFDGSWQITNRCGRCEAIYQHLRRRINVDGADDEVCHLSLHCGHSYKERWAEDPPTEIAALAFWRPGDKLP